MGYTGYEYDVFISYAHADDIPDAFGNGWVGQFQDELRKILPQRLKGEIPSIFFDRSDIKSNHQLGKLRAAARNSAVFVAITSPNYAARSWTREELRAFTESNKWNEEGETRICAVECLEPEGRDTFPSPLDTHIALPLWEMRGTVSIPLRPRHDEYLVKLTMVATDIAKMLRQIRNGAARGAAGAAGAEAAGGPGPSVLLAQATDDLEEQSEQVRTYLGQFNVGVLPTVDYPQGGEAFRAAFAQDLARAQLFVQLLSASAGRRPPDMPEGYTAFQVAAAHARGIPVMQWRSPDLRLDAVANTEHRALLTGEHVIVDSLEGFKAAVVRQVTRPAEVARAAPSSAFVFIDASLDDLDIARQIQSELAQPSAVPVLSGTPEAVRADLEANIVECDVLVLVNRQTTPLWVRGQLRLYSKLRGRRSAPPRVLEVVIEPPEEREEHGMHLEEMKRVRVRGPLDRRALAPVLRALSE